MIDDDSTVIYIICEILIRVKSGSFRLNLDSINNSYYHARFTPDS
jgi:hypothetical protein